MVYEILDMQFHVIGYDEKSTVYRMKVLIYMIIIII